MSRGNKCSICTGENVAQINAMLESGLKLKDVALQVPGLSLYALSRHKRNCLEVAPAITNGSADPLEQQIGVWLQRSEELWLAGGASLDLRSQGQAISSAFRALEFARKNQERMEEKATAARDLPTDISKWTPEEAHKHLEFMDWMIAEAAHTSYATPDVRVASLVIAMTKNSELLNVAQRLADDPAMLVTVQTLMKGAA